MTEDAPDFEDLPPSQKRAIADACARFEDKLRSGSPVTAVGFAAAEAVEPRTSLLRELLVTEIEYRRATDPRFDPDTLLDRLPEAAGVVREAIALSVPAARPQPVIAHPDGSPVVVGDYRLVEERGRGRFGVVFRAIDLRDESTVALKLPHPTAILDAATRDRFVGEARAAERLTHPNVVRLLESGTDGAICYLAYEYEPGPTLAAWLTDRGGLSAPSPVAAALVLAVAGAISHAHEHGVLHLDLKPSNILLAGSYDAPIPRVTDFGLARLIDEPSALSTTGVLAGTPSHMAPEQVSGRRTVDARTDVYALGAILYELLTGRPPGPVAPLHLALAAVARGYPPLPRSLRPDVPRELEAICLKCLEKAPARRYPSVAALAADLAEYLAGRRPAARPLGLAGRTRWWVGRNPTAAYARLASAAAVAFLIGLTVSLAVGNRWLRQANQTLAAERETVASQNDHLRRRGYADAVRRAAVLLDLGDVSGARRFLDGVRPTDGEADLRGFEWHLIDRDATPTPHRVAATFSRAVTAVAYAADGATAAAGGVGGEVRLFEPATGRVLGAPLAHPADVKSLAFAPDGRRLAVATADGRTRVWTIGRERPPRELRGHEGRVQVVAWSPDGRHLATGGRDGTVWVWDESGDGRRLVRVGESVRTLAWSADGRSLVAGGDPLVDRTNRPPLPAVWDVATGEAVGWMPGPTATVAAAFVGETVLSAHRDGTVRVWRPGPGREWGEAARLAADHPRINDMAVSRDGRMVAVAQDGMASVWRLGTRERIGSFRVADGGRLWAVALSPDGTEVLAAGDDGRVRAWPVPPADTRPVVLAPPHRAEWLAFNRSARDRWLAVGGSGGGSCYAVGGATPAPITFTKTSLAAGGFDPSGRPAAVTEDGVLCGWSEGDGPSPVRMTPPSGARVFAPSAVVGPEGRFAAVLTGRTIRVRSLVGDPLGEMSPGTAVAHLAAGRDGRLAAACFDRTVRVWDARTGTEVARLLADADRTSAVALGPGDLVAAGCGSTALVWRDFAPRPVFRLLGHRGPIRAVDFHPDGRTLATGGADGTVRLWRLDTGFEALSLAAHPATVVALRFSPDGRFLAVAFDGRPNPDRVVVYDAGVRSGGR